MQLNTFNFIQEYVVNRSWKLMIWWLCPPIGMFEKELPTGLIKETYVLVKITLSNGVVISIYL
jgi:hypothetical protein